MQFTIQPPSSEADATYPVTVTIKDDNPVPLTSTYTFNIIVKAVQKAASSTSNSTTTNSTFKGVVIDDVLPANASKADRDKRR